MTGWRSTSGAWRAEIHDDSSRSFIPDLVSTPCMHLDRLLWLLLLLRVLMTKVFASANTSTILNRHVLVDLISEFEAATVVILAASIAAHFLRGRWALIGHRHVALPLNRCSDRRDVIHGCIGVRAV